MSQSISNRLMLTLRWPSLIALPLALAALVSWWGTRESGRPANRPESSIKEIASGPLYQIDLPIDDPECPEGPFRESFRTSCTLCHSTRLVFTQPYFPGKKWSEIVKKMVTVYGAPLVAKQEEEVVIYLTQVRGK